MSEDRYYLITHSPDTTETGLPTRKTYVKITWGGHDAKIHDMLLLEGWCEDRYGSRVDYVQGVAPVRSWEIWASNKDQWERAEPMMWGGVATKTIRLALALGRKRHDEPRVRVLFEQDSKESPLGEDLVHCPSCGHVWEVTK